MPVKDYGGKKIEVEGHGFLVNALDWDERVACALAEEEGVDELTSDMMDIIKFMRDYYKKYNFFPILNAVCKKVDQPRECITEKFIDPLTAWKIAGLPYPDEHLIAYFNNEGGVV